MRRSLPWPVSHVIAIFGSAALLLAGLVLQQHLAISTASALVVAAFRAGLVTSSPA